MPHRYFPSEFTQASAALTGPDAHHLGHVLRAKPGDEVTLCDGAGFDYTARVTAIGPERVDLALLEKRPCTAEPTVEVTLFVGYPKQDKLETIVQKAVELGAVRIVPFFSRFCVAAPKGRPKNIRYTRIAAEAAKQCSRGRAARGGAAPCLQRSSGPPGGVRRGAAVLRKGGVPLRGRCAAKAHRPDHRGRGRFRSRRGPAHRRRGRGGGGLGPASCAAKPRRWQPFAALMAFTGNLE